MSLFLKYIDIYLQTFTSMQHLLLIFLKCHQTEHKTSMFKFYMLRL